MKIEIVGNKNEIKATDVVAGATFINPNLTSICHILYNENGDVEELNIWKENETWKSDYHSVELEFVIDALNDEKMIKVEIESIKFKQI